MLQIESAAAAAAATATSSSSLPSGYVPGAAGTGDEHITSAAPGGGGVTASDVANALMAATVKADVTPRQSSTSSATATSGGAANLPPHANFATTTALSATSPSSTSPSSPPSSVDTDTEESDYSVPPDLTLNELEAITDLARESVLEREKTELALIKANIVADTADDDDEANERNIENNHSGGGVAVAAVKAASVAPQSQSGTGLLHTFLLIPHYSFSNFRKNSS